MNLGWPAQAEQAIAALQDEGVIDDADSGAGVDVATVLRAALRKLSRP